MQRGFIIDRDLFAGLDVAQGDEEYVIVKDLHVGVGLAGVIDVVSAVAATAAIEAPAIIDCTDAQPAPVGPAIRLGLCNFLAGVFRYFPSSLEVRNRKTTLALDWRFLDR